MRKKAQIGNLPNMVITIVIVGLLVAIGLILFDKFGSAVKEDITATNTTFTNATTLPYAPVSSVSAVYCNGTYTVVSANYTFSDSVIRVLGSDGRSCASFTATFIGRDNTSAYDSLVSSSTAVGSITDDWLSIIVIIMVVGIILGLIMLAFGSNVGFW
jgi:hypothetical protein